MKVNDRFLWLVVAALGINITQVNRSVILKCLCVFMVIMFFVPPLHFLLGVLYNFGEKGVMRDTFYITLLVNCLLIWYLFFSKRKALSASVLLLSKFQKRYRAFQKNELAVKLIAFSILFLEFASFVVGFLSPIKTGVDLSRLFFRRKVADTKMIKIMLFYILGGYTFCICVVALLSFSLSVLWYRWSIILSAYNDSLRLGSLRTKSQMIKCGDFFVILNSLRKLDASVSSISFFIIALTVQLLFNILYEILFLSRQFAYGFDSLFWAEKMMNVATAAFLLVSYVLSCARIPQKLKQIRLSARDIIRMCGASNGVSRENLFSLETIVSEDILYVSACDMFPISKSILLSIVGVALTYNLLILNYSLPGI